MFRTTLGLLAVTTSLAQPVLAEEDAPVRILDDITVIGSAGGADAVAGSATYLEPELLDQQAHSDILRILRDVPGVNIQEEEGYGLRPNIGLRGSGSNRSSRVALMEDGVPIAPAAYAAPSAYYFPTAARLHAVEVTKGPAVIRYGPRTTGGAINMFSTPIPEENAARFEYLRGDYDRERFHGWAGTRRAITDTIDGGVLVEVYDDETDGFLEIDNGTDRGFEVSDLMVKAGLYGETGPRPWAVEFKYQTREETSDQTYLGLTQADFEATPFRLYNAATLDQMNNENELLQLTHRIELAPDLRLTTLVYQNDFFRSWFKLQGVNAAGGGASGDVGISSVLRQPDVFAEELALLKGEQSLDDSLVVRDNRRAYRSYGIQSLLDWETRAFGLDHEVALSVRRHSDEMDRFQREDAFRLESGEMILTTGGAAGSQSNRVSTGEALSVFVEDRVSFGRTEVTGGLRYEDYKLTRLDFSTDDPFREEGAARVRINEDEVLLPAISALHRLSDELTLLGGVHRGFAIPSPGNTTSEAEKSWNYEFGGRFNRGALSVEAIAYFNDYSNLIGICTESSGGGCTIGDQFDAGAVDVYGLELSARHDLATKIETKGIALPVALVYTFTDSEFQTSFESDFGPWGDVQAGDELPYVPNHQVTLRAGAESEADGWGVHLAANYVDEARATAGQGPVALEDSIDPRVLVDASAYYEFAERFRLTVKAENLFDKTYLAARRPAGARPGKPQEILFGIEADF